MTKRRTTRKRTTRQRRTQPTEWKKRDGWGAALGEAIAAGSTYERKEPARTAQLAGDVLVPLSQSFITGAIGALAGGLLGGWKGAAIGAVAAFGLTWLVLLRSHRELLWLVERVSGRDWDDDGAIGEPPSLRVEMVERRQHGGRLAFYDLPVSREKLTNVARAVLVARQHFSRPDLCARGKILTQSEYHRLAAAMEAGGLLVKLPNNTRELTAAGRSLLRELLE